MECVGNRTVLQACHLEDCLFLKSALPFPFLSLVCRTFDITRTDTNICTVVSSHMRSLYCFDAEYFHYSQRCLSV